jgi:hypothetical protein
MQKYTYDMMNSWIYDDKGNVVCQFWSKSEEPYINAHANGAMIAAALNAAETGQHAPNTQSAATELAQIAERVQAMGEAVSKDRGKVICEDWFFCLAQQLRAL